MLILAKVHFILLSWRKTLCGRDIPFSSDNMTNDIEKVTCRACKNKSQNLILNPITEREKERIACLGGDT